MAINLGRGRFSDDSQASQYPIFIHRIDILKWIGGSQRRWAH